MKSKILSYIFVFFALFGVADLSVVQAQPGSRPGDHPDHFAERKAEIVKRLSEEKSILDQFVSCVNGSAKEDDLKKCHEARESSMKKVHEEQRNERRKHLQDELKKLDDEATKK